MNVPKREIEESVGEDESESSEEEVGDDNEPVLKRRKKDISGNLECNVCQKAFKTKCHLRIHKRTHSSQIYSKYE